MDFSDEQRDMLSRKIKSLSKVVVNKNKKPRSVTQQMYDAYFVSMKDTENILYTPENEEVICNILWEKKHFPNKEINVFKINSEFSKKNIVRSFFRDFEIVFDKNNEFIKQFLK
jgi:hypothetical protein